MQLLSLPSMALRLVANLQFCLRLGVATSEMVLRLASLVSATRKQGIGTDVAAGFCKFWIMASEQGLAANCPDGVQCLGSGLVPSVQVTLCWNWLIEA